MKFVNHRLAINLCRQWPKTFPPSLRALGYVLCTLFYHPVPLLPNFHMSAGSYFLARIIHRNYFNQQTKLNGSQLASCCGFDSSPSNALNKSFQGQLQIKEGVSSDADFCINQQEFLVSQIPKYVKSLQVYFQKYNTENDQMHYAVVRRCTNYGCNQKWQRQTAK